jgi:hypothetical protein
MGDFSTIEDDEPIPQGDLEVDEALILIRGHPTLT